MANVIGVARPNLQGLQAPDNGCCVPGKIVAVALATIGSLVSFLLLPWQGASLLTAGAVTLLSLFFCNCECDAGDIGKLAQAVAHIPIPRGNAQAGVPWPIAVGAVPPRGLVQMLPPRGVAVLPPAVFAAQPVAAPVPPAAFAAQNRVVRGPAPDEAHVPVGQGHQQEPLRVVAPAQQHRQPPVNQEAHVPVGRR